MCKIPGGNDEVSTELVLVLATRSSHIILHLLNWWVSPFFTETYAQSCKWNEKYLFLYENREIDLQDKIKLSIK